MYAHQFVFKLPIPDQVELSEELVGTLSTTANEVYRVLKSQTGFVDMKFMLDREKKQASGLLICETQEDLNRLMKFAPPQPPGELVYEQICEIYEPRE
jgi:hypothetical protein